MKASEVESIGLQKVVRRTSSMHSSVVSGLRSASMSTPLSVDATSALSTHEQSTGSAPSAAAWTLALESLRHSMTSGMHSGRHGPIVRGARAASSEARFTHSILKNQIKR